MTPLDRHRRGELPLAELTAAARQVLNHGPAPADGRVVRFPDERTIRYYQSLGLIGRPLRYEGREAIYGFDHLLRVVAVKLLQNEGYSLAQVQGALAGSSTATLEAGIRAALGREDGTRKAPARPPPAAQPPGIAARPLLQAELLPGIQVTIDPAVVAHPERVLRALRDALPPQIEGGS
ncbi:MAG: MerR family transcriptional regulator [Planctomycetota bacterium]